MKVPVQVSVEGSVLKRLRDNKTNVSGLVNDILKLLDETQSVSAEEMSLAMLQFERDNYIRIIDVHRQQIAQIEKAILLQDEKIAKQASIISERRKSERVAKLITELNEALDEINFDYERALQLPVLEKLKLEGIPVTDKWLQRHIQRIETMGR